MHISYRETFAAGWSALEKRLLPSYVWTSDPLTFWRERILFLICFIAAVFGPIALVPSLLLSYREGLWIVILVDSLAYMAAVTILIARNVSFAVRALILCFILYALGVCILFILGPVGAGYIWLFGASVLISAFIGLGAAIWTLIFNTIILLSVGYFIAYGNPEWILHVDNALEKWLVMSANFLLLNAFVTITTAFLLNGLKTALLEEQKISKSLRQSEELFRSYLEYAPDGVYMSDLEGNFLYGNRKCEEIIGYRREELVGKNFLELSLLPEKSLNKAAQLLQANIEGKPTGPDEIELINKEGCLIPVEINTNVVKRMGQRIVLATVRDITDRKFADENLRKSEERYRTILEDMDEGYFEVDLAGNFTFVNDAECRDLGYSREELIDVNYQQYSDEATAKELYEFFSNIYKTGNPIKRFPGQFISKDGRRHFNEVSASLIRDANGKPIGFRGISQDVTERKRADKQLQDTLESLRKSFGTTIQVMVSAVETRDPYTSGHQIRATNIARAIATEMGLSQDIIEAIRMAGPIHDIGKLSVPAEILSKPGKLSALEFSLIKEHARKGYEMLKDVESPWPLAQIVYQHHERMDGSGYPRNLKGDEILMEARIMAVADVVESMASHRPYRAALGIDIALNEIEKNRGVFYDNTVADACLRLFREKGFKLEGT